jgi:ankyrin repeat protein
MANPSAFGRPKRLSDIVKLLLEHGGNPNTVNHSGDTPLDTASSASVADILLANGGHVSADGTPLRGVDRDLLMAAVVGNGKGVRSSVSRGAHINIRIGSQAETPLIRAVYLGRTDAATALLRWSRC